MCSQQELGIKPPTADPVPTFHTFRKPDGVFVLKDSNNNNEQQQQGNALAFMCFFLDTTLAAFKVKICSSGFSLIQFGTRM